MTKAARKHRQYIRAILGRDRPQLKEPTMTIQKTDGLTNTEILEADKAHLTSMQRQVQYVAKLETQRKGCPNCGTLSNLPEAAGVRVDDFNFANHGSDRIGACRGCQRTLIFTLPLIGDWHWRLDPAEATMKEPTDGTA